METMTHVLQSKKQKHLLSVVTHKMMEQLRNRMMEDLKNNELFEKCLAVIRDLDLEADVLTKNKLAELDQI